MILLCRCASAAAMFCCYVFTAELYPTPVRQIAAGYSTGVSTLMCLAGPYIGGSLVRTNPIVPLNIIVYNLDYPLQGAI